MAELADAGALKAPILTDVQVRTLLGLLILWEIRRWVQRRAFDAANAHSPL